MPSKHIIINGGKVVMFSKKNMIFIMLILILFTLSTVSAADNATTDVVGLEDVNDEAISIEETQILADDDDEVIPNGTFDDLRNDIDDDDDIDFERNYTYNEGFNKSGIVINKDLKIDGHGFTIDAKGQSRIFIIESGKVVIRNVNFLNANATDGGAIYGQCTLENCNFINNTASGNGGAVYGATVKKCTFSYNTASGNGGAMFEGYAEECTFRYNNATNGGATYGISANNCIFNDNMATNDGGAVFDGDIDYSTFNANSAGNNGGGMCNGTVHNSNFINNVAGRYGGATYEAVAQNCTEEGNRNGTVIPTSTFSELQQLIKEADAGSTIVLDRDYKWDEDFNIITGVEVYKTITIDGNGFTVDGAKRSRIFNVTAANVVFKNLHLINGFLDERHDVNYGSAISGSEVSKAINCYFNNGRCDFGGASDKIQAFNCTFKDNVAKYDGAALYYCDAWNCTFINNRAGQHGGGIYNGNAVDCTFIGNHADSFWGGGIFRGSANSCTFIKNHAHEDGGGLYVSYAFNCTFINNTANKNGQGMFGGTALLCAFENNDHKETNILVPTIEIDSNITKHTGDKLSFKLTYDGTTYNGYNTTIKFYQLLTCVGNYSALSGNSFVMNITPGEYDVELNLEKYPEIQKAKAKVTLDSPNNLIISQDIVAEYNSNDYFASFKTSTGLTIANTTLSIKLNDKEYGEYITDEDGKIKVPLKNLIPDTYLAEITFKGNEFYGKANNTSKITINKGRSSLTANDIITFYKIDENIVVTLKDNNGDPIGDAEIFIDLNGVKNYTTDKNGQITLSTEGLVPNTYIANVTFEGNKIYNKSNTASKIIINKYNTKLTANNVITQYKVDEEMMVILKDNYGNPVGGVSVFVDLDEEVRNYTTDENGQFTISTKGLTPDSYIVGLQFKGNDIYQESNVTAKITVDKGATDLAANSVETEYNVEGELVITLKNHQGEPLSDVPVSFSLESINNHATDENGQIKISTNIDIEWVISFNDCHGYPLSNVSISVDLKTPVNYTTDKNGQIKLYIKNLNPDTYVANLNFEGNDLYLKSNSTANVIVNKESTELTANVVTTTYNVNDDLVITLTDGQGSPISNAQVSVDLDGVKNYTTDDNGQIKISSSNISPDNYNVKITFNENSYYLGTSTETAVSIKKANTKLTVDSMANSTNLIVSLMDEQGNPVNGTVVSVDIKGINDYTTDSKGQINIPTDNLAPGNYNVKIKFNGNENYTGSSEETTFIVKKSSELTANNVIANYNESKDLIITLKDGEGKPIKNVSVSVDLNGVKNHTTDSEGQIKIPIHKLTPNNYNVRIKFDGNSHYIGTSTETAVIVKKATTKIIANNVTTIYNTAKNLVITLKDSAGNPIINASVSVNLKGIENYTTNENGQIKIPVQKLTPKTYVAKISYGGDNNYVESDSYGVVVVKKITSKLTAKAKTFKVKTKTKKYSVILKTNKNKAIKNTKVYLKVNGKTYAAKTNKKGKATFKITKLTKKGKFTAVVTYKGSAYYNKTTKKVKITTR